MGRPRRERFRRRDRGELPTGNAWSLDPAEDLAKWVDGCAQIWGDVSGRATALLVIEIDPRVTQEMLSDWERNFGLPDPCSMERPTQPDRHAALIAKMTAEGAVACILHRGRGAARLHHRDPGILTLCGRHLPAQACRDSYVTPGGAQAATYLFFKHTQADAALAAQATSDVGKTAAQLAKLYPYLANEIGIRSIRRAASPPPISTAWRAPSRPQCRLGSRSISRLRPCG